MDSNDLLEIVVDNNGESAQVTLVGELDMATARDLDAALSPLVSDGPSYLRLDISALSFMDIGGLHAVIAASESARTDGFELEITPGPEPVQRLFRLTGTESQLPFSDDLYAAA
jgi:anti-sigma B factor antagonist